MEADIPEATQPLTNWNVRLPEHIERDVLRCLESANAALAIEALTERHPEFARQIRAWAANARVFSGVAGLPALPESEVPSQIGMYRVLSPIGSGGFGSVFLGQRDSSSRPVALKLLNHKGPEAASRLRREITLLSSLDHPALVDIRDSGEAIDGRAFYAMDFIPGRVLDSYFYHELNSNEDFVTTILQICDALSYVHRKGIIHRDLKPANIIVDDYYDAPRAHLVDFGLASSQSLQPAPRGGLRMAKTGRLFEQTLLTAEGGTMGTPAFMAPEQILDAGSVDGRADLYSLGVTIYLLLSGRFPVSPREILNALAVGQQSAFQTVVQTQIAPPTQMLLNQPGERVEERGSIRYARHVASQLSRSQRYRVDQVVMRCLEKDPESRHANASLFADELAWAFGRHRPSFGIVRRLGGLIRRGLKWLWTKVKPEPKYDEAHRASVLFVTDRKPENADPNNAHFGSVEADGLTFGASTVGLPNWRVLGRLRPRWWERLLGRSNYQVIRHRILDVKEFSKKVGGLADALGAVVFIHGYNTSFDQAMIRATQLQADLKLNGRVICYSWPSLGRAYAYGADAAIVESSERHLMEAVRVIGRALAGTRPHVVAHSMGNRALLRAVSRLHDLGDDIIFGQMILAGPDVGQRLFQELSVAYIAKSTRCTLYASKHDRALMGSSMLHARGRAGYIPPVTIVNRIDTIDASRIGFRLWGLNHSNFGDTRELLTDIAALIFHNVPPEHRIGLERQIDAETGGAYWMLIP